MRRRRREDESSHERWLVSYADFITLLFAFFVVMYAMSQADLAKFKKAAQSLEEAFSGKKQDRGSDLGDTSIGKGLSQKELTSLKAAIVRSIRSVQGVSSQSMQNLVEINESGLIVRLAFDGFYDSGEVNVHRDLLPLLDRIGKVLRSTDRLIRIEGHSDPVEEKFIQAKKEVGLNSGWELSSGRAAWVLRYWVRTLKFEPQQLAVSGYSHYQPIAEGDSRIARARNRRIELVIRNESFKAKD